MLNYDVREVQDLLQNELRDGTDDLSDEEEAAVASTYRLCDLPPQGETGNIVALSKRIESYIISVI